MNIHTNTRCHLKSDPGVYSSAQAFVIFLELSVLTTFNQFEVGRTNTRCHLKSDFVSIAEAFVMFLVEAIADRFVIFLELTI